MWITLKLSSLSLVPLLLAPNPSDATGEWLSMFHTPVSLRYSMRIQEPYVCITEWLVNVNHLSVYHLFNAQVRVARWLRLDPTTSECPHGYTAHRIASNGIGRQPKTLADCWCERRQRVYAATHVAARQIRRFLSCGRLTKLFMRWYRQKIDP